jgi:hypothetical protein
MEAWAKDHPWLTLLPLSRAMANLGFVRLKFEMRLSRRPAAADHFPLLIAIPSNPSAVHR